MIRGSFFVNKQTTEQICETCYRKPHYESSLLTKVYKHCILTEVITPEMSRNMCPCNQVPHCDDQGQGRTLFPVDVSDQHVDEEDKRCNILNLGRDIALAKYHGLLNSAPDPEAKAREEDKQKKKSAKFNLLGKLSSNKKGPEKETARLSKSRKRPFGNKSSEFVEEEELKPIGNIAEMTEKRADGDIPFFFRQFTEQYPFGNVHMGLRVGPLMIENGVPKYVCLCQSPDKYLLWQYQRWSLYIPAAVSSLLRQVFRSRKSHPSGGGRRRTNCLDTEKGGSD